MASVPTVTSQPIRASTSRRPSRPAPSPSRATAHHTPTRDRRRGEEVRRAGGIGFHRVAAGLISLAGRDAERAFPVPLARTPKAAMVDSVIAMYGTETRSPSDLDLHVARGIRRGQQQRAEVLARDVPAHPRAAAGQAVGPHDHGRTAVRPGSRHRPRGHAARRSAAGSGACAWPASRRRRRCLTERHRGGQKARRGPGVADLRAWPRRRARCRRRRPRRTSAPWRRPARGRRAPPGPGACSACRRRTARR